MMLAENHRLDDVSGEDMAGLEELAQLFGAPPPRRVSPDDWIEIEEYVGSPLPSDFKAFVDAYGPGTICGALVLYHPREGGTPLLERMRYEHDLYAELRADHPDHFPYPFHPDPGGLVSWGCDTSGDEHFFLSSDPNPNRWKIVTMIHESGCETFDGSFTDFIVAFAKRLKVLGKGGTIRAAVPSFTPWTPPGPPREGIGEEAHQQTKAYVKAQARRSRDLRNPYRD